MLGHKINLDELKYTEIIKITSIKMELEIYNRKKSGNTPKYS